MSRIIELNRRDFLMGAGSAALGTALAGTPLPAAAHVAATRQDLDLDAVYERVGTNCYKWDKQIERFGADAFDIGMGVADMDFRCAPCVTEALQERIRHQNWGYLHEKESLKDAIVAWNREHHGVTVDPASLEIADGVHPGLIAALHALAPPGTPVLMNSPTYGGFYSDLRRTRTLENDSEMWIDGDGRYQIDWDDFEARLTPETHVMILCNPQNPTGNCWSEADLLRIGRLCLEHEVVVLADEIHCDFVMRGERYVPFASLPDREVVDNSLTFKAISKTFSLAGMKNAYFYSTNPVLLERVRAWHRADSNTLGVVANEAAYREGRPWFDRVLAYIDRNHDFVEREVAERLQGVRYTKAQGTYLAWLDTSEIEAGLGAERRAREAGMESAEDWFERWLVEHAGVQLNPGANYGTGGGGHMRMNLAAPRPVIAEAIERIEEAIRRA